MINKYVFMMIAILGMARPAFARNFDEKLSQLFGQTVIQQRGKYFINILAADSGTKLGTCYFIYNAVEVRCYDTANRFLGDESVFQD